jgi:Rieske 2Fe-2S family protein
LIINVSQLRTCNARNIFFMQSAESMLARLKAHGPERALPRDFYTHPDYFAQELHSLWYREWLFFGLECELAKAGDSLTATVGEYPVLVLRDGDGALRAFHNACRPGTNPAELGLKPLHCTTLAGFVFICLAAQAPDFDTFARAAEPYLLPHHLRDAKVAFESTIVEHANWKLVWENNRECYHCAANHPELCRTFPSTPTVIGLDAATANRRMTAAWERWEKLGLPSQFELAASGQSRLVRMPLVEDMVSFTLDGKPASRRPLSDSVTAADVGSLLMFHYPSTWNHVLGDHATTFRVLPLSATETQLTTKWLVHKDSREGLDYETARLTQVWSATNDEDRRVCQENQLGVNSPAYEPAPYSPVWEAGVMQFMAWYRDCLIEHLGDELP